VYFAPEDGDDAVEVDSYTLPANRSFVLQVLSADDGVIYSGYHFSSLDLPVDDLVALPDLAELRRRRRRLARRWGTVVGGTLLAGAGVTLAVGLSQRAAMTSGSADVTTFDDRQALANTMGWTSGGLAVLGVSSFALSWGVNW
jgi:hypothetical protein